MPRIRHIKPEFFRHEKLQDLEREHPLQRVMLTYAGLWCVADAGGCFKFSTRQLKNDILPDLDYDRGLTIQLLIEGGFIELTGQSDGDYPVARIINFTKHQWINRATEKPKYSVPKKDQSPVKVAEAGPGEQDTLPGIGEPPAGIVEALTGEQFIEEICMNNGFEKDQFSAFALQWAKNKAICRDVNYKVGRLRTFLITDFRKEIKDKVNVRRVKKSGEEYVAL